MKNEIKKEKFIEYLCKLDNKELNKLIEEKGKKKVLKDPISFIK